jgi:LPS-assembly protein
VYYPPSGVEMGRGLRSALCRSVLALLSVLVVAIPPAFSAQANPPKTMSAQSGSTPPIEITAQHLEYLQGTDVYEAEGSVVIVQGPLRLTADRVTIMMLSGTLIATGHVHLSDPRSDLRSERLELDVNTEAGVVTNGELNIKFTDTLVTGRLFQRFSEDHYRVKDGSFTNCDVKEGVPPAWRFTFKDLDLNIGESIYAKDLWLCVNDIPVLPLPTLSYPVQTNRRSGFLVPTVGYNTVFGTTYTHGYFWAINPSHDMTVTPTIMTDRGYGSDLEYRYMLNRKSRGQWLMTFLQDTTESRTRAFLTGTHVQQVNPDLSIRAQAFLVTDRSYLNNLSNSGSQRALPSGDSSLYVNQRFAQGNLYLIGQLLQPITAGGSNTFQRLPEIGHRLVNAAPFDGPLLVSMDTTLANFYREQGPGHNRIDLMPTLSTDVLDIGHVVGFVPQVRLREIYYTKSVAANGAESDKSVSRETLWASLEGSSRLVRRFGLSEGGSVLHTIEPHVIYEYVPPTKQSDIVQVDDVDDLPKKNLITYSLRSRLLRQGPEGSSKNWLDLTVAQSYHLGSTPNETRQFVFLGDPQFDTATQPIQPPSTPVDVKKFSDIWTRVVLGNPVIPGLRTDQFGRPLKTAQLTVPQEKQMMLTVDSFYNPYRGSFSQWNTDLRYQDRNLWYVEVGQRFTNDGNRVRRGDIWNPISFNTVFAPTAEIDFVTASAAFRTPLGWTVGAKSYYDIKAGTASETDVVALYQNPCRCWSLGLFYMKFPDRTQYNFMISLTGVGWTENFGTEVVKSILSPLLIGERGLPWAAPGGPYGMRPATPSVPPGPTQP